MKNIKKIGKCGKRIAAMALVMAMLLGVAAMVVGVLNPAWADDSEYNFTTKPLDVEFYRNTYPDLSGISDPLALFEHYADYGIYEGRIPYAGAEPGAPVAGYTTVGVNPDLAADATLAEQTDTTGVRDLSDWTPAQLAMLAQKQAEFDASPYVKVGWTEQQVKEKLDSLKSVYPEGSYGGICSSGAGRIGAALYGLASDWFLEDEQGLLLCDKAGMRVMPVGFVEHESVRRANGGNIRDVRVGDVVYTMGSGAGHVSVVLSRDNNGITVVESNLNSDEKFHWGRRFTWDELENGTNKRWYEYTHYLY